MKVRAAAELIRFESKTTIREVQDEYPHLRQAIIQIPDGAELIDWVEKLRRPADPIDFVFRIGFVIMVSGFRYCVCRRISKFVNAALLSGQPVVQAFRHPGKAAAIEQIWGNRQKLFATFRTLPDEQVLVWCESLPWVGPITRYQAARDLGMLDVAKPDRHMRRLAATTGETVQVMCERVAETSGDRIATVDLLLWYAMAHGLIRIES